MKTTILFFSAIMALVCNLNTINAQCLQTNWEERSTTNGINNHLVHDNHEYHLEVTATTSTLTLLDSFGTIERTYVDATANSPLGRIRSIHTTDGDSLVIGVCSRGFIIFQNDLHVIASDSISIANNDSDFFDDNNATSLDYQFQRVYFNANSFTVGGSLLNHATGMYGAQFYEFAFDGSLITDDLTHGNIPTKPWLLAKEEITGRINVFWMQGDTFCLGTHQANNLTNEYMHHLFGIGNTGIIPGSFLNGLTGYNQVDTVIKVECRDNWVDIYFIDTAGVHQMLSSEIFGSMNGYIVLDTHVDIPNKVMNNKPGLYKRGSAVVFMWSDGTVELRFGSPFETEWNVIDAGHTATSTPMVVMFDSTFGIAYQVGPLTYWKEYRYSDTALVCSDVWNGDVITQITKFSESKLIFSGAKATTGVAVVGMKERYVPMMTSFDEVEEEEVARLSSKIYPNPAKDFFIVELKDYPEVDIQVQVFDIGGRMIMELPLTINDTRIELNVYDLASGVYLVKVNEETHKLIKQ